MWLPHLPLTVFQNISLLVIALPRSNLNNHRWRPCVKKQKLPALIGPFQSIMIMRTRNGPLLCAIYPPTASTPAGTEFVTPY